MMEAYRITFASHFGDTLVHELAFRNDGELTEYCENVIQTLEDHLGDYNWEWSAEEFEPPTIDFREHPIDELIDIVSKKHPASLMVATQWNGEVDIPKKADAMLFALRLMKALNFK